MRNREPYWDTVCKRLGTVTDFLRLRDFTRPIAVMSMLAAWSLCGVGYRNGDAAVYVHQATMGDLNQRWVHLGYLALGSLVSPYLDVARFYEWMNVAAAGALVIGMGRLVGRDSARRIEVALLTAAVVLPQVAGGELDLPWIALVVWATALPAGWGVALCFGAAMAISPVAVLTLPWMAMRASRRHLVWAVGGAVLVIIALTGLSLGDWWVGDRGVLTGGSPRPYRSLIAWAEALGMGLGVIGLATLGSRTACLLPLLLAPADVPVWVMGGLFFALELTRYGTRARRLAIAATGVALVESIGGAVDSSRRMEAENAALEQVASVVGDDGLVAAWTYGVRVSLLQADDPYGMRWITPEGGVREQQSRWCADPPRRSWVLGKDPDGDLSWSEQSRTILCVDEEHEED